MKRRTFARSALAGAVGTVLPGVAFTRVRHARQEQDIGAVTGDGRAITLSGRAIADLDTRLRGRVLLARHAAYDDARRVLNPSFDKHPALIAQITGTADVRVAVDFAREHDLLLAVKCGGHSASGKSTCDRGMMIDLSPFRDVRVDPGARRAWVSGGNLLGALDHETMAYDLVTPMGTVSHTGVGGLVTGGGFGRVARRFGLSVDNLTAVDVVTADGQFRRANAEQNADLFWGVRGGSGNFGIVTAFQFRLHPMQRQVLAGNIFFPTQRAREVLRMYGEYGPEAPDELQLDFMLYFPAGGEAGVVGCNICYSGAPAGAERALAPIRALGGAIVDAVEPVDYVALQRSGDIDDQRARASYLKSGFFSSMPERLMDAIVDRAEGHATRATYIGVQQSGGAIGRVGNDATAFAHRDAIGNLLASVDWRYGDDASEHVAWIKEYWTAIEPFMQGFYANDGDPDAYTQPRVNANFRDNYPRLVEIKNRYDPGNLFRLNANVVPTV